MERVGFGWFHANVLEYSRENVRQIIDSARLTGPGKWPKLKSSSTLPRSCQEIRLGEVEEISKSLSNRLV